MTNRITVTEFCRVVGNEVTVYETDLSIENIRVIIFADETSYTSVSDVTDEDIVGWLQDNIVYTVSDFTATDVLDRDNASVCESRDS
jgi:hypothetical protein